MLKTSSEVNSGCEACSIRAVLMSPHISCEHDAVARARITDWGLFDPEIRPFISMRYICSVGTYIGPLVFNSGAGRDTILLSRHLGCYRRVTYKGYPTLGTCTTLQYHFYYATCPHRCIHESLLALYQLGNYKGRYITSLSSKVRLGP